MNKSITLSLLAGIAACSLLPTVASADVSLSLGIGAYPPPYYVEPSYGHYRPAPVYYAQPEAHYGYAPRFYGRERWDHHHSRHGGRWGDDEHRGHGRRDHHDNRRGHDDNRRGRDDDRRGQDGRGHR